MPGIEYVCARAHGLRGRLLGPAGAAALLARADLAARVELLGKSDYAALVPEKATSAREATRRLRERVASDAAHFLELLEGKRRPLLAAALALADVWTLKTILRGVDRAEPAERLLRLLEPTPELDLAALRELAAQQGVRGVIALLATWGSPWAEPLEQARRRALPGTDLLPLDVALDRAYFARGFAAARKGGGDGTILARILGTLVDLVNAATLLRIGRHRPDDVFVEGGETLHRDRFRRLAALDAASTRGALAADVRLAIGAGLGETVQPFLLDRWLGRRRLEILRREARLEPLSIAVPLLVLAEREEDVRRIRLVLEAAEAGVPAAELSELLQEMG